MTFRLNATSSTVFLLAVSLATTPVASASLRKGSHLKIQGAASSGKHALHRYVESEVLVKMRSAMSDTQEKGVMSRHGVSAKRTIFLGGGSHLSRLHVDDGTTVMDKIAELQADPDVESAQPNYIYHTLQVPNDPQYGQLWGLKNAGQKVTNGDYATANPGTAGKDMSLEAAWDITTDCSGVVVAVVDTGINYTHEDLRANLWDGGAAYPNHGYNFVDNNNDPLDLNGHGSHVSATIGAAGNNGLGTTGICWKAKIMAVRVLDATGTGFTSDIAAGISFATAQGAKVINMSLGQGGDDPQLETALKSASDAGVVIVVAAGNDGANNDAANSTGTFPCNSTVANLVCVAALDQSFGLASFSNYGATSVDVGAPGTNILSGFAGTETVMTDTFHNNGVTTTNWTTSGGGWAYGTRTLMSGGVKTVYDMLLNPSAWDGATAKYANNLEARIYKTFNLSAFNAATFDFGAFVDIDASDAVSIHSKSAGGDPFSGGTQLDSFNGSTSGSSVDLSYDLTNCRTATCSVGFQLKSDAATADFGMGIFGFEIDGLTVTANAYRILDGTSMATPHVTGLAAMIASYNPKFTAADIVNAIKQGGSPTASLAGKTTTGKAANALGSLTYIAAPTAVAAVQE